MALAPFWMTPENVDDAPWLVRMAALVPLFVTTPGSRRYAARGARKRADGLIEAVKIERGERIYRHRAVGAKRVRSASRQPDLIDYCRAGIAVQSLKRGVEGRIYRRRAADSVDGPAPGNRAIELPVLDDASVEGDRVDLLRESAEVERALHRGRAVRAEGVVRAAYERRRRFDRRGSGIGIAARVAQRQGETVYVQADRVPNARAVLDRAREYGARTCRLVDRQSGCAASARDDARACKLPHGLIEAAQIECAAGVDRRRARVAERIRRAAHQRGAAIDRGRPGVGVAAGRSLQRRHAAVCGEAGRAADPVDHASVRGDSARAGKHSILDRAA